MSKLLEISEKLGITVKSVKTMQGTDGLAFSTTIAINGRSFAIAHDSGRGGCVDICLLGEITKGKDGYKNSKTREVNRTILKGVEIQLEDEPSFTVQGEFGDLHYDPSLEDVINALIDQHEAIADIRKIQAKGILTNSECGNINITSFGNSIPTLVKNQTGRDALQRECDRLTKKGVTIINKEYLQKKGVKF